MTTEPHTSEPTPPRPAENVPQRKPWYRRTWFHAVLFIFLPFVQVPVMWFQKVFTLPVRIIMTILGLIWTLAFLPASDNTSSPSSNSKQTAPADDDHTAQTGEFSLGWFGPKGTIHDGAAHLEFEWNQPTGGYNGYDQTNFTAPDGEMYLHGEEVAKAVYEIAGKYADVNRIEIGITVTFNAWSYEDKYGKRHEMPEEKIHTGDLTIADIVEVRKYTKSAYVDANRESFAGRLLPLVNDRNRTIHPED